jgi:hypothetical protein
MATMQLAGPEKQRSCLVSWPKEARPLFDDLVDAVAAPRPELSWYRRVGGLIGRLQVATKASEHDPWFNALSAGLGPSAGVLRRMLRLATEYADPADLRELEATGAHWSKLGLTGGIRNMSERHRLLRRAVQEGWKLQELRFRAQALTPPNRRGVGGRPRKEQRSHGPEATLRELVHKNQGWAGFCDEAWKKVTAAQWEQLLRDFSQGRGDQLKELLQDAAAVIDGIERRCRGVQEVLEALRRQAGRLRAGAVALS